MIAQNVPFEFLFFASFGAGWAICFITKHFGDALDILSFKSKNSIDWD